MGRATISLRRSDGRFGDPHVGAREVARMHGTPIYVLKHGKIVAVKP